MHKIKIIVMNRILFFLTTLLIVSIKTQAVPPPPPSPYPFNEDFETSSTIGGSLANWTQTPSLTFATQSNHGTNGSIGLRKNLFSLSQKDSISTMQIGPLTAVSEMSFDYRIVDAGITYPSTATTVAPNFSFKVIAKIITPFPTSYTLFTINAANHITSTSFKNMVYQIPASFGSLAPTVYVWFVLDRGSSGDFYVDIDNVRVGDNNTTGINTVTEATALIRALGNNSIALESAARITNLSVYSMDGKSVFTATNYENNQALNLNTPGIYFVQFNNGNITERRKVSIQ
jgi:hypothetical protein